METTIQHKTKKRHQTQNVTTTVHMYFFLQIVELYIDGYLHEEDVTAATLKLFPNVSGQRIKQLAAALQEMRLKVHSTGIYTKREAAQMLYDQHVR